MANPVLLAKRATFDKFLEDYDPEVTPYYEMSMGTALMGALANRDAASRVAIANRLLDDGADPAAVTPDGETSLLHVLLDQRSGLTAEDAGVLARLLEGGADVNLPDGRKQVPLAILYNNYTVDDEDAGPLYDVLFSRPDLNLEAPASRMHTVRELLALTPEFKPDFQRRARAYQPHDQTMRPSVAQGANPTIEATHPEPIATEAKRAVLPDPHGLSSDAQEIIAQLHEIANDEDNPDVVAIGWYLPDEEPPTATLTELTRSGLFVTEWEEDEVSITFSEAGWRHYGLAAKAFDNPQRMARTTGPSREVRLAQTVADMFDLQAQGFSPEATDYYHQVLCIRLRFLALLYGSLEAMGSEHRDLLRSLPINDALSEPAFDQALAELMQYAATPVETDPHATTLLELQVLAATRADRLSVAEILDLITRYLALPLRPEDHSMRDGILWMGADNYWQLGRHEEALNLVAEAYALHGENTFAEHDPQWRERLVARGDVPPGP